MTIWLWCSSPNPISVQLPNLTTLICIQPLQLPSGQMNTVSAWPTLRLLHFTYSTSSTSLFTQQHSLHVFLGKLIGYADIKPAVFLATWQSSSRACHSENDSSCTIVFTTLIIHQRESRCYLQLARLDITGRSAQSCRAWARSLPSLQQSCTDGCRNPEVFE